MEPLLAFAPRADVVALLTPSIETWLRDELGPVAPETVVVPNALPQGHAPRSLLDGKVIVTAGRLVMEKQFTKLVAAFADIADQLPDWRLRIYGTGPKRQELLRHVRKLGLYDRVELPGAVSDMRGEWAKASICALTSRAEGHMALFNPSNDYYGMSPIEAASTAIDLHNAASNWNKALLDNAARPSGALVYSTANGHLNEEQFARLKAELESNYQGALNAGRPMLLEGGLDWKTMSLSPQEMDFIEAKHAAAREIALALGVPPMLLGIPGDNSYANYAEANRVFWRQTVLPLAMRTAKALTGWLEPQFGERLDLRPALDRVDALSGDRAALWDRMQRADFLSVDEKRAAVGYGPLDAGE
jgi:hypothetical protein